MKALTARGVQTIAHYPVPIHQQKAYSELGFATGSFPISETAARSVLSLPMFPEITKEQVTHVTDALRAVLSGMKV